MKNNMKNLNITKDDITRVLESELGDMSSRDLEKLVRDYLNGNVRKEELMKAFDLVECPICGNIELEEDTEYHTWDIGEVEEKICQGCREDE